jgi:putative SOS response-associated peptidase YedK
MCDRYVLPDQAAAEREFLPTRNWWNFAPKFNVVAASYVPTIRWHEGQSEAAMMRWGFIPSWAEGATQEQPPLDVNFDEVLNSPTFRSPWLNSQRCILLMAGFYVWQLTDARYRQPYYVRLLDRAVFGVAAIWDRSLKDKDDVIESCAMLCVAPNDLMIRVANTDARMPAILRRRDYQSWLRGTPVEAKAALVPYKQDWMEAYRVSPKVNSPSTDDATLILPAG